MDAGQSADQPHLLMLSHCVPDALGDADRARAWQMLRLASASHRVFLAAVADGPINLPQWRAIHQRTTALVIQPVPRAQQLAGSCAAWFDLALASTLRYTCPLLRAIDLWQSQRCFDALLCTHPALWRHAVGVGAPITVCDFRTPASYVQNRLAQNTGIARNWWHGAQAQRLEQLERRVADECDTITVNHVDYSHRLLSARCRTLVVPDTIDPDRFADGQANGVSGAVNLLLHADWRSDPCRDDLRQFVRRVWPTIRAAAPGARLRFSARTPGAQLVEALRRATVVVAPTREPAAARFPILQAMAAHRVVIADEEAALDLGARSGEHLLTACDPRRWADAAIFALRSAQDRLRLTRQALALVESCRSLDPGSRELTQRLWRTDAPLARAA